MRSPSGSPCIFRSWHSFHFSILVRDSHIFALYCLPCSSQLQTRLQWWKELEKWLFWSWTKENRTVTGPEQHTALIREREGCYCCMKVQWGLTAALIKSRFHRNILCCECLRWEEDRHNSIWSWRFSNFVLKYGSIYHLRISHRWSKLCRKAFSLIPI